MPILETSPLQRQNIPEMTDPPMMTQVLPLPSPSVDPPQLRLDDTFKLRLKGRQNRQGK